MDHVRLKKVVITGGLGFIGSALSRRLLAQGSRVLVIDNHLFGRRLHALPEHPNLTVKNIDIRNRAKLAHAIRSFKPDSLFHLAAIAFIPTCTEDPGTAVSVHVDGTINVLHAARLAKVKNLHFASSADVYSSERVMLSEKNTPLLPPADVYGPTKLAGEALFCRFYQETGAHVVITRAFNVYGPLRTNRFLIPSICEQLESGVRKLKLGNLHAVRDYIHVDDFVDATISLMTGTKGLVVANVGSGHKTTIRQVIALCEDILEHKIRIISSVQHRRPGSIDRLAWQADISYIRQLIGWKPTISLAEGLRQILTS